jgi:hypothetical protein
VVAPEGGGDGAELVLDSEGIRALLTEVHEAGEEDHGQQQQKAQHPQHVHALSHRRHHHLHLGEARAQFEHAEDAHEPDDAKDACVAHAAARVRHDLQVKGQDGDEVDQVHAVYEERN